MDFSDAASGISVSLQTALNLTNGIMDLAGNAKAKAEITKLKDVIFATREQALAVQERHFAMLDRVRQLEKQIAELEAWSVESEKYEIVEPAPGVFAYSLKTDSNPGKHAHLLCANCFEKRRKSVIQRTAAAKWDAVVQARVSVHQCTSCSASYDFGKITERQLPRSGTVRATYF